MLPGSVGIHVWCWYSCVVLVFMYGVGVDGVESAHIDCVLVSVFSFGVGVCVDEGMMWRVEGVDEVVRFARSWLHRSSVRAVSTASP